MISSDGRYSEKRNPIINGSDLSGGKSSGSSLIVWMSKFICWMWALYRFSVVIISAFVPSAADALVSTIAGVDTIMLVNVSTYMVNSLGEKYIYSDKFVLKWLDKGGFNSLIGKAISHVQEEGGDEEDGNDDQNG